MQTFIVRIYRAHPADNTVTGIVKDIESREMKPFQNLNGLLTILLKFLGREPLENPVLTRMDTKTPRPVPRAG